MTKMNSDSHNKRRFEMHISLKHLSIFLKLAKLGNFSETANAMKMSQSAVSRQMAELEVQYGQTLVERVQGRYQLTDSGQVLYHDAKKIITQVENITLQFDKAAPLIEEPVVIGISETVAALATNAIAEFKKKHAHIPLTIKLINKADQERSRSELPVDVYITDNNDAKDKAHTQKLYDDEFVLVFNKQHRLAKHKTMREEQLTNEQFIVFDAHTVIHQHSLNLISRLDSQAVSPIYINQIEAVMLALANNMGISLLPKSMVTFSSYQHDLCYHALSKPLPKLKAYLRYLMHDKTFNKAKHMLIEHLIQHFKEKI